MKVIFKTDLSHLLSLVFVSLSLIFVHVLFSCFDLLFLLVLEFMLIAREFTYCHIRNVIRLALSDVNFITDGRVCGGRADRRYLIYFLTIANLLRC